MAIKKWEIAAVSPEKTTELEQQTGLSGLVCGVLAARGLDTAEKIEAFIQQDEAFHDPYLMKDMHQAVDRIHEAIENQEQIVVYGDYDCDGITAAALLCSYLAEVGADVSYYIPKREGEGYGMNARAVKALAKRGIDLIITVDNGISSIEETRLAKELGVDVIITDHHTPREILPEAVAVLNPHRMDCQYPFQLLSGVGVAFKLVCALEDDIACEDTLYQYGAFAALGTVADVVELRGENRAIVRKGLESMEDCGHPGICALLKVAGYGERPMDASALAYGIAPRINAAGRMEQTNKAVELLLSEDEEEAEELAEEINELNIKRRAIEQEISKSIEETIRNNPQLLYERVLVIAGENWHHGVIGIIASKLVEKYGKPCILISVCGEEARGSARSVEGYSIIDAISRCSRHLTRFGGHTMAAGLSLSVEEIDAFRQEILEDAEKYYPIMPAYAVKIDMAASAAKLTVSDVQQLELLQPYGAGNEQPVFGLMGVTIEGISPISDGKHIRIQLSEKGKCFQAVYFGMSPKKFPYQIGDVVDIAADVSLNVYHNNTSVSIKVKDIRLSGVDLTDYFTDHQLYEQYKLGETIDVARLIPTREEAAKVYRFIRSCPWACSSNDMMFCRLAGVEYGKLRIILEMMEELSLIEISATEEKQVIHLIPQAGKLDLESSKLLQKLREQQRAGS